MSTDDYRLLFEGNPSPMLIYEVNSSRLLAVNDAFCAMLGFSRAELVGKPLPELHLEEDRASVETVLAPVRSGEIRGLRRWSNGLRQVRKDGRTVEVETLGQDLVFDGKPARLVRVEPVEERRRARQLEQRYAALFEKARDFVIVVSPDGRILEANPAALHAYGYRHDELSRMRLSDLRDPATLHDVRRQMQQAGGVEGILFETVHRRRDGSVFPVEVSSTSVELEGRRVLLSVIRDVSERRRVEEVLRAAEERSKLRRSRAVELADELEQQAGNPEAVRRLAAELRDLAK